MSSLSRTVPRSGRTVLLGGLVADGSGGDPFLGDVLVAEERIDAVLPVRERPAGGYDAEIIDCTDHVVAPGFVDIHTHSDLSLLAYPDNQSRITQGVTTAGRSPVRARTVSAPARTP